MLRRFLRESAASTETVEELTFQGLIRLGNQRGLLKSDWRTWSGYSDMHAKTSHTYDEAIALQIIEVMPSFVAEAELLLRELSERCE